MKILLLANPASVHTVKWANSLSDKGIDIFIFGLNKYDKNAFNKNIKIETLNIPQLLQSNRDGSLTKIIYLLSVKKIKNLLKKIKPDILHAHYVSSYGVLGALINFHPYIISAWGSDILIMPGRNIINKKLIEFSLSKADKICATSKALKEQAKKYTSKDIEVIPFGIDIKKFKPEKVASSFTNGNIVVGTVKTLEKKYGIEYLIRSFKIVKEKLPEMKLKLLIVGGGSQENQFKKLVTELNLESDTLFTGYINQYEIPKYHNMMDIFVSLSDSESFGVSALEASACEKPVVVSDADGFKEIVKDSMTGIIVKRGNIEEASIAILNLIKNTDLRFKLGAAGRDCVLKNFNWNENVTKMVEVYNSINF